MNLPSFALTLFVNLFMYLLVGTIGLAMLSGVFGIPMLFNNAIVIGLVLFVTDIFASTVRVGLAAVFSREEEMLEINEQVDGSVIIEYLEDVLNVLIHCKGNTPQDEQKRRELLEDLEDSLE